jgi:hypothetical protein
LLSESHQHCRVDDEMEANSVLQQIQEDFTTAISPDGLISKVAVPKKGVWGREVHSSHTGLPYFMFLMQDF